MATSNMGKGLYQAPMGLPDDEEGDIEVEMELDMGTPEG